MTRHRLRDLMFLIAIIAISIGAGMWIERARRPQPLRVVKPIVIRSHGYPAVNPR